MFAGSAGSAGSESTPNFGKVPEYITERKKEWQKQAEKIQQEEEERRKQQDTEFYQLSDEQVQNIREKLQHRWNELNQIFQLSAHKTNNFNSESHQQRRENLEKQIDYVTRCIERVSKDRIFIDEKNEFPTLV